MIFYCTPWHNDNFSSPKLNQTIKNLHLNVISDTLYVFIRPEAGLDFPRYKPIFLLVKIARRTADVPFAWAAPGGHTEMNSTLTAFQNQHPLKHTKLLGHSPKAILINSPTRQIHNKKSYRAHLVFVAIFFTNDWIL